MPKRPRRKTPPPPILEVPIDFATGKVNVSGIRLGIPPPLSGDGWKRFFLAVRAAVDRNTPGLLGPWDDASITLNIAKHCRPTRIASG